MLQETDVRIMVILHQFPCKVYVTPEPEEGAIREINTSVYHSDVVSLRNRSCSCFPSG